VVCHEDRDFVVNWYKHTSRRIREVKRSPSEIVALCSNCHSDKALIARHVKAAKEEGRELGRKSPSLSNLMMRVSTARLPVRFHQGRQLSRLPRQKENYYMNVHDIRASRDPESPVSAKNKVDTCRHCHTHADENYAQLDPHPTSKKDSNAFRYYANIIYAWVGNTVIALLVGMALLETIGRRRDGVGWILRKGSSWWRKSSRDRDRIE